MPPSAPPLLEMSGIVKSFPGVQALRGVGLRVQAGEVLALLGENGAGKSTLMKILGGAQRADAGTVRIDGCEVGLGSPVAAARAGIAVIHQEFNLVPGLSAAENIFLGRETTRAGFVARADERRRARELFDRLGASFDADAPCRELTTAHQQMVEIAKALAFEARLLVMDEPTAALTSHEVKRLFAVIRDLKARGLGIIYISHRLEEIAAVADRIVVLRDGANVGERPARDCSRNEIIEMMVGREMNEEFPDRLRNPGSARLVAEGLSRGRAVREVSFSVRRGEIVGLAGLVGAGRTETARLLFGADSRDSGTIMLDGRPLDIRSPRDAIAAGIGLLPEDRKHQGLVLAHAVRDNFALPSLDRFSRLGMVDRGREGSEFAGYAKRLGIRVPHAEQPAVFLSGGNQQKVVLAKWLARHCEVLIFDEPTRGIDAGAKYEIYQLLNDLTAEGKAVVMISSELPELIGMADRILVMHEGRLTGEITDARRATQEEIMHLAIA